MNGLPSELVSLLGSSLFGCLMRLLSFSLMARHKERLLKLCRLQTIEGSVERARNHPQLPTTRRIIALLAVFSIIVLPKWMAVFRPDIPISIGYSQLKEGFLFFTSASESIHWEQLKGLVITPLDTHLLSAIIGLYFGSALIDFKNA